MEAATNTASEPIGPPPGTTPLWGAGAPGLRTLGGQRQPPQRTSGARGDRRPGPLDPQSYRRGAARPCCWHTMVLSSRSRWLAEGIRTMADVTFGHRTGHTPPATMDHPGQWHYLATRLMAHMGAYSPDEMNGLHWQWHQRAALRIRTAMQDHGILEIPGSPGYQGQTSGHQRPRSQDVPEPAREAARRNSPERPQGPPPGRGSPSGTYSSFLRPFAPRRSPGSPRASGVQGGTPE